MSEIQLPDIFYTINWDGMSITELELLVKKVELTIEKKKMIASLTPKGKELMKKIDRTVKWDKLKKQQTTLIMELVEELIFEVHYCYASKLGMNYDFPNDERVKSWATDIVNELVSKEFHFIENYNITRNLLDQTSTELFMYF